MMGFARHRQPLNLSIIAAAAPGEITEMGRKAS